MKTIEDYPNYSVTETGEVWRNNSGKLKKLKSRINAGGYLYVSLWKNNKEKKFLIHRLVAAAFIPNPNNLPFACHMNDMPNDASVENLFWGTRQDNIDDKVAKGRQAKGSDIGISKLTNERVLEIRKIGKSKTQKEIAKLYDIHQSLVSYILSGKIWKDIS